MFFIKINFIALYKDGCHINIVWLNALVIKFEASLNSHCLQLSYVAFHFKRTDWDNELVRTKSPSLSIDDILPGPFSIICLPNSPLPSMPSISWLYVQNPKNQPCENQPNYKGLFTWWSDFSCDFFLFENVNKMIYYRSLHNYLSHLLNLEICM